MEQNDITQKNSPTVRSSEKLTQTKHGMAKMSACPCVSLVCEVTMPVIYVQSFREKWLTPPVWRHDVFSVNHAARHPYHDLDKLTLRDFIRVKRVLLALTFNCSFFVQNSLNAKRNDPASSVSSICIVHTRGPVLAAKLRYVLSNNHPCYTKGTSTT
jgi:hypothetical protein